MPICTYLKKEIDHKPLMPEDNVQDTNNVNEAKDDIKDRSDSYLDNF